MNKKEKLSRIERLTLMSEMKTKNALSILKAVLDERRSK